MYYQYDDPETGRFVNVDGYVSTGQGVFGYYMFALDRSVRIIDGCDAAINGDEYRTALRVKNNLEFYSGTPDTISWDNGTRKGYYDSKIVYFAISN